MAARQQQQIEHQQQVLVAKEQRLKYLKQQEQRQQQIAAENDRLRKLREKVETQEMKLKKLRALRGEVEKYQSSNGSLNSELESVKALFTEKEKELVMAVAKVEELTRQLEQIRQDRANVKNGSQNAAALELDKLRKELMIRNKLNEQQSIKLSAHREMLSKRKDEVAKMDNRIHELQQRLKKKRAQQSENTKNSGSNKSDNKNSNRPSNVAAVEPYIQYKPPQLDHQGDLKARFEKQDPKYQTLPPNTRFPTPENGKLDEKKTAKEQNNNTVKEESEKFVTDVSKHGVPNGPTLSQVSDSVIRAAQQHQNVPSAGPQHRHQHNVLPVVPPHTSANQNKPPPPPLPVRSATTGLTHLTPRPFGSTYSTSVLSNKPHPQTPQENLIQNGPIINIQEDVRQGGSGQSSPASSDNSQKDSYPVKNNGQLPVSEYSSHVPQNQSSAPPRPVQRRQPPIPDTKQGTSSSTAKDEPDMSVGALKRAINSSRKSAEAKSNSQNNTSNSTNSTVKNSTSSEKNKAIEQNGVNGNSNVNSGAKAASSKQIANIYLGRLGKGASQRYQDSLNMLYKKISDDKSPGSQSAEIKDVKTSDSNVKADTNNKISDQSSSIPQTTTKPGHWQAFSPPGSPNHPDIASDKASHNRNSHHTPKGIRRRHSDSDNEENQHIAKLMHKHQLDRQQNQQNAYNDRPALLAETQATSFIGGVPENVPVDRMGNLVEPDNEDNSLHDSSNSSNGSNSQPSPIPPEIQRSADSTVPGKKTNLRRANSKGSGNRVSFDPLALLLDASLEGELELVKRCASQVKNVSESNDEGITALHNAICAGHYDIVTFLVEFGCDVNSPDSDGWTPLHCAASCNNLPMVIFLVEHGACIFATTISDQETAAEKCEEDEDGFDGCSEYLYSVQEKLGILNGGVVYAVFDYEAKNSDELDFRIGDEITVLRKGDDVEKEWWWSRNNGKEAYVPRNLLGVCRVVLMSSAT
ncbi:hypothetical protein FSP39_023198 [Pinctada imbricata]|uniref:SH3 domain-containing protein n=1 Tax=Pinctada imbricata TaxID=66713 RepID=A0AA89C011_PINIB|nr:hypothetical protein FSP39_023198 [Pinctada imbricata]